MTADRAHLARETWGDKSEHERVHFWCPGCDDRHAVLVNDPTNGWGWNDDLDLPTFTPSVLVDYGPLGYAGKPRRCHSFVTDGRIQFLGDCTHNLAGQTVDVSEWSDR